MPVVIMMVLPIIPSDGDTNKYAKSMSMMISGRNNMLVRMTAWFLFALRSCMKKLTNGPNCSSALFRFTGIGWMAIRGIKRSSACASASKSNGRKRSCLRSRWRVAKASQAMGKATPPPTNAPHTTTQVEVSHATQKASATTA